jgi:hypothetical protein
MTESANEFRISVLFSLHRALLGAITPELRTVQLRIEQGLVRAFFHYDAEYSEEIRDIVSDVEAEVVADIWQDVEVRFEIITCRYPGALQRHPDDESVYLRREDDSRFETSSSWQVGTVSRDVGGGYVYHESRTIKSPSNQTERQ